MILALFYTDGNFRVNLSLSKGTKINMYTTY